MTQFNFMFNNKNAIRNLKKYENKLSDSLYFTTHKNWKSMFREQTRLTSKKLNNFLNQDKKISFGIGVSRDNHQEEIKSFEFLFKIQNASDPDIRKYLSKVHCENILGEVPIKYENYFLTRSNLMNAETAFYLNKLIPELNKINNLKILEIGSGYGELCRQLIKHSDLDIRQYDLVDLPKNLLFSEKYLTTIFHKSLNLKTKISYYQSKNKSSTQINFYLPEDIPKLKKYNLIINSYSLQEMEVKTAKAYHEFIQNSLTDNGYFYSLNSPVKWDIKSYNDYNNLKNLNNKISIMHRQIPPSIEGTVPIINIFKKSEIVHKRKNLELISLLQSKGFTNLLNIVFKEFNLTNFSVQDFDEKIKKHKLNELESLNPKDLKDEEIFCYLANILIFEISFNKEFAKLFLEELLYSKNKNVSLKLIYEFSKKINRSLTSIQINDFLD